MAQTIATGLVVLAFFLPLAYSFVTNWFAAPHDH